MHWLFTRRELDKLRGKDMDRAERDRAEEERKRIREFTEQCDTIRRIAPQAGNFTFMGVRLRDADRYTLESAVVMLGHRFDSGRQSPHLKSPEEQKALAEAWDAGVQAVADQITKGAKPENPYRNGSFD